MELTVTPVVKSSAFTEVEHFVSQGVVAPDPVSSARADEAVIAKSVYDSLAKRTREIAIENWHS